MATEIRTAESMAREGKSRRPDLRIAYTACGSAAGVWCDDRGRFVPHVEKSIIPECPWVRVDGVEPPLVNGARLERQWIEV